MTKTAFHTVGNYPSRTLTEPMLFPRLEPVVWSDTPAPDWLPEDAMERYQRDGFLVLPGLFDGPLLRRLQTEMEALLTRLHGSTADTVVREPGSAAVRSVFDLPTASALLGELAGHPRLLAFARHVLGSGVYLHQSRLNFKPGPDGKEFYWHSDFET